MLTLRRGIVLAASDGSSRMQNLEVSLGGETRPAINDLSLMGLAQVHDDVLVNIGALDLGLGSGGFDIVHANLTRGLSGDVGTDTHVMKLNYTSLQHPVEPFEAASDSAKPVPADEIANLPSGAPVAVCSLHGQLAPLAWAFRQQVPGARLAFVQTLGGALPGALSRVVEELLDRDLVCDHVTVGACFGGTKEAISTAGALHAGFVAGRWDAAVCGPGPGILGSGTRYGHGGMVALESAHTAAALGCRVIIAPRYSSSDPRPRHRGLSHHTETVLAHALVPFLIAAPSTQMSPRIGDHRWQVGAADLDGYLTSNLPATTMGRSITEDPDFFRAALAAGTVLGSVTRKVVV